MRRPSTGKYFRQLSINPIRMEHPRGTPSLRVIFFLGRRATHAYLLRQEANRTATWTSSPLN